MESKNALKTLHHQSTATVPRVLAGTSLNRAFLFICTGLLSGTSCMSLATDDLKPFPQPESGYQRVIIRLPEIDTPDDHRVELIFGKTLGVDCNRHFFSAELTSKVAEGWGYNYFVLQNIRGPASTLMACPPDEPKRNVFVRVITGKNDAPLWQRYNPKLPIVVYVPDSIEVRYRIWSADQQISTAQPE